MADHISLSTLAPQQLAAEPAQIIHTHSHPRSSSLEGSSAAIPSPNLSSSSASVLQQHRYSIPTLATSGETWPTLQLAHTLSPPRRRQTSSTPSAAHHQGRATGEMRPRLTSPINEDGHTPRPFIIADTMMAAIATHNVHSRQESQIPILKESRSNRHCGKCGLKGCPGTGGRKFCRNTCRDCGHFWCSGRGVGKKDALCPNASRTLPQPL
jgi:hypothetical protein